MSAWYRLYPALHKQSMFYMHVWIKRLKMENKGWMFSSTALVILLWYEMAADETWWCVFTFSHSCVCAALDWHVLWMWRPLVVSTCCYRFSAVLCPHCNDIYRWLAAFYFFPAVSFIILLSCVLAFSRSSVLAFSFLTFLWYHIKRHSTNTALMILIWYHKADIIKITWK